MVKRVDRAMHPLDSQPAARAGEDRAPYKVTMADPLPPPRKPREPHSIEQKALAIAAAQLSQSSLKASDLTGIPSRTIREWVYHFESVGDSDLDLWVANKRRSLSAAYLILEAAGQELAYDLAKAGDANGYKAAMTGAGIACDKTKGMGGPKIITSYASTEDKSLLDAFQTPNSAQSPVKLHDNDAT